MELLYIGNYMFIENEKGVYGLPSSSNEFFSKYLYTFDKVRVLGEPPKDTLNVSNFVHISNDKISVRVLPPNRSPKDLKNDYFIRKILIEEISNAKAIIIKPLSRKGIMAIKIAKKLKKPYMIEVTGDIHNALKQHPNIIKRLYAPFLYFNIRHNIKDCKYGLYVSKDYLQSQFPIDGIMCGCADVVLKETEKKEIIENRIYKIDNMSLNNRIDLGLIGFYQGKMKGVDTAIRALSHLPNNFHLSILGNGTKKNRDKWINYGQKLGIKNRIHFPPPLPSSQKVLEWLDNIDIFVFPTRSEGLCRSVAEALSRGCPIFATNICTMPEMIDEKFLFTLDDDRELAELITYYVHHKDELKEIAKNNFLISKNYNYEVLKERRNKFLQEFKNYCLIVEEKGQ